MSFCASLGTGEHRPRLFGLGGVTWSEETGVSAATHSPIAFRAAPGWLDREIARLRLAVEQEARSSVIVRATPEWIDHEIARLRLAVEQETRGRASRGVKHLRSWPRGLTSGIWSPTGGWLVLTALLVLVSLRFQSSLALLDELLAALFLALAAVGTTTLVWMLHAWRSGDSLEQTRFPALEREPVHSFSLILPARHEQAVLVPTVAKLAEQRHPAFEVIVVVGHDDPETYAVAIAATADDERFRVVVDTNDRKN